MRILIPPPHHVTMVTSHLRVSLEWICWVSLGGSENGWRVTTFPSAFAVGCHSWKNLKHQLLALAFVCACHHHSLGPSQTEVLLLWYHFN